MYKVLFETFLCFTLISATNIEDYYKNRTKILEEEAGSSLGGTLKLNEDEIKVNNILMALKKAEDNSKLYHTTNSNFTKHYFTYKDYIKQSEVYQLIKKMPKGAALHGHLTFTLDADFLLSLTYEDNLYACYTDKNLLFHFAENTPLRPCAVKWTLLSELRNSSGNVPAFDAQLKKHLTLICDEEKEYCPKGLDAIWNKFDKTHVVIKSLVTYRPTREKFIYESMKRLYEDNVMYAEMRTGLHVLYELNATKHDAIYTIKLHRDVINRFIEDHPDFIGVKLIITKHRASSMGAVKYALDTAKSIKKIYPEMIAGFDLVGQEDKGKPLTDFIPLLLESKNEIDYFFHAGETNWFGVAADENLIDAILLGTKRIGHGYALSKHPVLMGKLKQKDIAVEVNVISNAVLALVSDLRDHPLANFLSLNLPVVLSSDDPGVWGADPLSHDFYISFMAVANRKADLRLLKQLALNSIRYSALDFKGRISLTKVFAKRWNQFLQEVIGTKDKSKLVHKMADIELSIEISI